MLTRATVLTPLAVEAAIVRNPLIASPDTPVRTAIEQMNRVPLHCDTTRTADSQRDELHQSVQASCVLVVEAGQVVGMLTERDVVRLSIQPAFPDGLVIRQVMTTPVFTLHESAFTDLFLAVDLLQQHHIRHLPILDQQDCPVGLVTPDSLQWAIALQQATSYQQLQAELSARQQAEARLRASEQRYATLVAAVPVGIFRTDAAGQCTYVNDRWCQITGLTLEEALGEGWRKGLYLDDHNTIAAEWYHSIQDNRPFQLEYRFQRPDGLVTWVYGQSVAEHDAQGYVIGYVGTITDINEHKRSEAALQNSEAHQRALVRAIPDLIMRINRAGIYLEFVATPNFHVVGDTPDMVGTHVSETLPLDLAQKRLKFIQLALQTNSIQIYEQDLSIDGRTQIEEVRVVPYSEDEVLVLVRDISDRKQAEFALQKSEAKSRAILVAIPDLMFRVGADGLYRGFITERRDFGIIPPDIDPTGQSMAALLSPNHAERQFHYLQQALQTGELQVYEQQIQTGERTQHQEVRVVKSGEDEVLFMVRDITDRKQAEAALQCLVESTASVTGKDFFSTLAQQLMLVLKVQYVLITKLVGGDRLQTLAYWKEGQSQSEITFAITDVPGCEIALTQGQFYCASGFQERFSDYPLVQAFQVESYLGMSLTSVSGQWLGTLCIMDNQPMQDIQWAEAFLGIFSMRAAAELERQQATEALEQLNQELEARVEQRTAALRNSEAKLNAMFNQAAVGLDLVTLDGQYLKVNQKLCDILGYSQAELLSKNIKDVSHPDDIDKTEAERHQLYTGAIDSFSVEKRCLRKDGSTVWLNLTVSLVYTSSGEPDYSIGVAQDISDRKQVEEALNRQLATIEAAIDGIAILNPQGKYTYLNGAHAKLFGYDSAEELMGQPWQTLYAAAEISRFEGEIFPKLMETQAWRGETIATRRDGSTFDEEISLTLTSDGKMICVCRDISERKQLDTERRQAEQQLKAQQEFLRRLIDTVPNLIFVKNWDGQFTLVNQATANLYHTTIENLIGKTDADFNPNPAEVAGFLAMDREVMASMTTKVLEETVTAANGKQRYFQTIKTSIMSVDGYSREILGVATDISDRKKIEEQLWQSNEHLATANIELARATRLKDEFLANMSHELRTPLNAVLGMTEGLQDGVFGEINLRQIKALQTIERSGFHLLELINDILDIAKIEAGQLELDFVPTAIAPLCQSSFAFIKQQALKKRIQLEIKLPLNLPHLLIDERRIRQVLINLLNNAVKFTPEEGRVTLEVSRQRAATNPDCADLPPQNSLRIAIRDTGIGIAPENLNKLFQPFIQIDSALNRQYQGTGLGLALVKRIVELHGGQVGLTSEVGVGSCFTIDLPYTASEPSPEPEFPLSESLTPQPAEPVTSPLILLAEDNEANVHTITSYLIAKGYRILWAKNGQEAIALAQSAHPDLILMDVQMPGMDGLTAIQQIRHDPDLATVPVIALTALAMTHDRDRCLAAGANDYLSKPIKLKALATLIQQLLAAQAV